MDNSLYKEVSFSSFKNLMFLGFGIKIWGGGGGGLESIFSSLLVFMSYKHEWISLSSFVYVD